MTVGLHYYEDRKFNHTIIERTGYYVNKNGMLQSVKGNDNFVPETAAEHWWGQRYDDGVYSSIVTQDKRWAGGKINTEFYISDLYFDAVNRVNSTSFSAVIVSGIGDLNDMLLRTRNWVQLNVSISYTPTTNTQPDGIPWMWVAGVAVGVTLAIVSVVVISRKKSSTQR